jgi:hypothetical protein
MDKNLVPQGIYVTEEPGGGQGVKLWCGYCCQPIHVGTRHWGVSPFLSLLVKMAQAHRETVCPSPDGPFQGLWSPRIEVQMWETTQ